MEASRLDRTPFGAGEDPGRIFLGAEHRRVLDGLRQALSPAERPVLVLLTAPDGCGKSTLLGRLGADLDDEGRLISRVRGPVASPEQFLRAILVGFGFEDSPSSRAQLQHILRVFLLHQGQQGPRPVVVVEDAQSLRPQVLDELGWLAQLAEGGRSALDIVVSGLPGLERIVAAPAMGVLSGRHRHLVELQPLDLAETRSYIRHRLSVAGRVDAEHHFDEAAVALVHQLTGGIPGLADTLCETALVCAAESQQQKVTRATVEAAAGKLQRVTRGGVTLVQGTRGTDTKAVPGVRPAHLVVMRGDELIGEYPLRKTRVLIGRRPDNDICLDLPVVSAYHALLLQDGDGWLLIDLHSTNGTYVSSQRIRQYRLQGDEVIGVASLQIRCYGLTRPDAAAAAVERDWPGGDRTLFRKDLSDAGVMPQRFRPMPARPAPDAELKEGSGSGDELSLEE